MVHEAVVGQVSASLLRTFPVSIIAPPLHVHLCIIWGLNIWFTGDRGPTGTVSPHRNKKLHAAVKRKFVISFFLQKFVYAGIVHASRFDGSLLAEVAGCGCVLVQLSWNL
jgi:hypothetical protein